MSSLTAEPQPDQFPRFETAADELIRQQVNRVFQTLFQPLMPGNRRSDRREPFPYPIYITPLDSNGSARPDETFVVLGKHLSERGVDFYHEAPVPYRRVIASFEYSAGQWVGFLLDLRWCRSNKHGWYENGGRFLQAVDPTVKDQPEELLASIDCDTDFRTECA